jgi:hypothetical protein
MSVVMKSALFWDITWCSVLKDNRRLLCLLPASCSVYSSALKVETTVSSKRRFTFSALHGFISQKIKLAIYERHPKFWMEEILEILRGKYSEKMIARIKITDRGHE